MKANKSCRKNYFDNSSRYLQNLRTRAFLAFSIFLAFALSGCFQKKTSAQTQFIFNTICSVNLYEDSSEELYAEIFSRLREIENVFNNYSPSSEISRVNENTAERAMEVSKDFFTVLKTALSFCELSGGAFDITVGPLVKLWNVTGENPRVPSEEDFARVMPLVGYKNVILSEDESAPTVRFAKKGVQLDLGAIAKGFAADEVEKILREKKVRRAVISLGGNIYVHGKKSSGEKWSVGIRNPFGEGNAATLFAQDNSVVTSGGYERFFEKDGELYSHILNPATGFPVRTDIVSITIICPNSMAADALSTSIFLCGLESIARFSQSPLCPKFECVAIDKDGTIYATRGIEKNLVLPKGKEIKRM